MKFSARTTLLILAMVTVLGAGYLALGVLNMGSTQTAIRLTLLLNNSGGLMSTSQVTMRGIKVGRVSDIQTTPTGLRVSIDLDRTHPVPVDSAISVQNLSVAGEQYIDFTPNLIAPPYFHDGALIPADRVTPTVTVSDLLIRANALFSALDPTDVHTIISNFSGALVGNDDTLDSLASTAGLFAAMVAENRQLLATLFGNVSTLTTGMGDLAVGAVFSETGKLLPGSVRTFTKMVDQFDLLSETGQDILGSDEAVSQMVTKLSEYLGMLAVPLGTFATALAPATARLRDVKVDAGHWLDFWESTFNDAGGLRVQVNVPEWHQP